MLVKLTLERRRKKVGEAGAKEVGHRSTFRWFVGHQDD